MEVLSDFVERLDELMFDQRVNGRELADAVGVKKNTIYYLLNGKRQPSVELLVGLADYFQCTTDFLLGREAENFAASFLPVPPFSERLPFLLEHFHTNKYRLCKGVPVTHSVIYYWQSGKFSPTLDYVIRLADFFGCSVDYVIGREK